MIVHRSQSTGRGNLRDGSAWRRSAQGNHLFHQSKFVEAIAAYTSAIEVNR